MLISDNGLQHPSFEVVLTFRALNPLPTTQTSLTHQPPQSLWSSGRDRTTAVARSTFRSLSSDTAIRKDVGFGIVIVVMR